MDRATWRAVSVVFSVIFVCAGVLAMTHFGQTDAACGTAATAVGTTSPGGNCSFAAFGYNAGIAALAVGCVLLLGAFVLTLAVPADG